MKSRAHRYRYVRHVAMSCFPDGRASVAPPTLSYATPQSWTYGAAITTLSPTTTGATSFAVTTGALPTGLSLNSGTGAITGTPTASGSGSFKVTATGPGGSTESSAVSWDVAFMPNEIASLVGWIEADGSMWQDVARTTTAVADADPVASVRDKKTSSLYSTNAEGASRPLLKTNILNGKPVFRFDGAATYLSVPDTAAQPLTIILVHASGDTGQVGFVCDGPDRCGFAVVAANTLWQYAGSAHSVARTADTAFHMEVLKFNGASSVLRENGADLSTGDAGAGGLASGGTIGANGLISASWFNGDVAARFVFSEILSAANITKMENWLVAKYGSVLTA